MEKPQNGTKPKTSNVQITQATRQILYMLKALWPDKSLTELIEFTAETTLNLYAKEIQQLNKQAQ